MTDTQPADQDTGQAVSRVQEVGAMQIDQPCDQLFAAIAKMQGRLQTVAQDKSVDAGRYTYTYADLGSLLEVCRAPLFENGLFICHAPATKNRGDQVVVTTILGHASGQKMWSTLASSPTKDNIQGMGAAITYMRRYAVGAMVGIASEKDTDGDGADQGRRSSKPRSLVDHGAAFRKTWHSRLGALVKSNLTPQLSDDDRHLVQNHLWGVSSMAALDDEHAQQELQNLRKTSDTLLAAIVNAVAIGVGECPHCKGEP